jgi:hypothetical protein
MLSKSLTFTRLIAFSALTTFSATSVVMAGMFPENKKNHHKGIWQIAIEGQDFGQSNNLAQITSSSSSSSGTQPIDANDNNFFMGPDPEKEWGYTINVGYIFPKHKYDVQASYTGLRADNDNQKHNFINSFGDQITSDNKANYNFSEAEITFGDYIKRTKKLMLRVGYGVAFVDIEQKDAGAFESSDPISGEIFFNNYQNYKNEFWGVGPKFTLDGQFDLNKYFGVVGGIGAAVLFGESKETMKGNINDVFDDVQALVDYEQKESRAVFGFDAKLGLRYMYAVNDRFQWNVEAGYKADIFIDALQDDEFSVNAFSDDNGPGIDTLQANEDYSNYGPYFNLSVDFM